MTTPKIAGRKAATVFGLEKAQSPIMVKIPPDRLLKADPVVSPPSRTKAPIRRITTATSRTKKAVTLSGEKTMTRPKIKKSRACAVT